MNITPLLDLAFVLLIIFVITSPFLGESAPLDVSTGGVAGQRNPERAVTVSIGATLALQLEGKPVEAAELGFALAAQRMEVPGAGELGVVVEAHGELAVHDLLDVMDQIKSAGITHVGVVAQPENTAAVVSKP